MKKFFSVFMILALVLCLAACGTEALSDTQEAVQTEESGEPSPEETVAGANALVVYFSATGNTKAVAETLAELQGADIYEIVPEQPYTDDDLNYAV